MIYKYLTPQNYKPIYKSEITSALNGVYTWNSVNMLTAEIANEELDREIRFEFFKSELNGKHKNIGYTSMTL